MVEKKEPVSVWASYLCAASVPGLLAVLFSHGRFSLSFTAATPIGRICAWLFCAMGGLVAKPRHVPLTRHGERYDDPASAAIQMQHEINQFTDHFFFEHAGLLQSLVSPDPRIPLRLFHVNLRKIVGQLTYDLLVFVEFARYRNQQDGGADAHFVILSPMAVLAKAVPPGWAGSDISFVCQMSLRYSLIARFAQGIVGVLARVGRTQEPIESQFPSVAAGAAWGLDRDAVLNDLYWWWESGIEASRVILFFDRSDLPAKCELVRSARELGIRCVVLNQSGTGDFPELMWRGTVNPTKAWTIFKRHARLLGWGLQRGRVGAWLAGQLSAAANKVGVFEEFLIQYNVRAVFHTNDVGSDFISLACEAVGAAHIGHQWSNIHWPTAYQARLHQVYFAWGQLHYEILNAAGTCISHVLLSGCIVKGAYPARERTNVAAHERSAVLALGAKRVLAVFDTSLPCEGFYQYFLEQVIQDSRWGLLIKPKGLTSLPWGTGHFPALQSLYEEALATGRVRMLDPRMSPADAAGAADIAVSVGVNSASVVAALAGHRAVHLDYVPLHASQLSKWAIFHQARPDRLVFDDPDTLWKVLNRFFDDPSSLPTLGLAGDGLLSRIDPFRDGQAGRRIGEYVRWYLEGLDRGLDRDRALADSTRRYAEQWGSAMVCRGLPSDPKVSGFEHGNGGKIEAVGVESLPAKMSGEHMTGLSRDVSS